MSAVARARAMLCAEVEAARSEINRAYWSFTRTASAAPPSSAAPEAYRRRRAAEARIAGLRTARAGAEASTEYSAVAGVAQQLLAGVVLRGEALVPADLYAVRWEAPDGRRGWCHRDGVHLSARSREDSEDHATKLQATTEIGSRYEVRPASEAVAEGEVIDLWDPHGQATKAVAVTVGPYHRAVEGWSHATVLGADLQEHPDAFEAARAFVAMVGLDEARRALQRRLDAALEEEVGHVQEQ